MDKPSVTHFSEGFYEYSLSTGEANLTGISIKGGDWSYTHLVNKNAGISSKHFLYLLIDQLGIPMLNLLHLIAMFVQSE